MNSRGLNGVNGLPNSPFNQPTPSPQNQLNKLSPEPAKLRLRKSFKRGGGEGASVEETTVEMDVDNDSS